MMLTSTALMLSNLSGEDFRLRSECKYIRSAGALVLVELIVVIAIMSLMVTVSLLSFSAVFGSTKFDKQAAALVNIMKMAQNAAAETDRKYAVILDIAEQTYTLRQFVSPDFDIMLEEEAVMVTGEFTEECQLEYVVFDDLDDTRDWEGQEMVELAAHFLAERSGWKYGGKIVLLDADGNPYTVIVNRLNRVITLRPGDNEFLLPRSENDVLF